MPVGRQVRGPGPLVANLLSPGSRTESSETPVTGHPTDGRPSLQAVFHSWWGDALRGQRWGSTAFREAESEAKIRWTTHSWAVARGDHADRVGEPGDGGRSRRCTLGKPAVAEIGEDGVQNVADSRAVGSTHLPATCLARSVSIPTARETGRLPTTPPESSVMSASMKATG